jgi:probable blue pigment (indigoidine) exporter
LVRELPKGIWLIRVLFLGGLNFSIFWPLLFVSAYRLPGGVAATINALARALAPTAAQGA